MSEVNSHCQAIFARMTDFFLHQKLGNRYVVSLEGAGKRTLKRSDLLGKNHGFLSPANRGFEHGTARDSSAEDEIAVLQRT